MGGSPAIFIAVIIGVALIVVILPKLLTRERAIKRKLRRARLHSIERFPDGETARIVGRLWFDGEPLVAPLSGRRCAYYHVVVEEKKSDGESHYWKKIIDTERGREFTLDDGTGRALVRTKFAETAITKDRHYRSGAFNSATDDLERFLAEHGRSSKGIFGFNRGLRYREGALEAGEEVTVHGKGVLTMETVSDRETGQRRERVLIFTSTGSETLLISDDTATVQGAHTRWRRARRERGACVNCGYDLRGDFADGCPECGWRR